MRTLTEATEIGENVWVSYLCASRSSELRELTF